MQDGQAALRYQSAVQNGDGGGGRIDIVAGKINGKSFDYMNHVIPPETDNEALYNFFLPRRIDAFLDGYNVNVMAYGQTGTGKTHTIDTISGFSCFVSSMAKLYHTVHTEPADFKAAKRKQINSNAGDVLTSRKAPSSRCCFAQAWLGCCCRRCFLHLVRVAAQHRVPSARSGRSASSERFSSTCSPLCR